MQVEFPLSKNSPWEHNRVVGLTNGEGKNTLYGRFGIAMLSCSKLKQKVATAESIYDKSNGHGLFVVQGASETSYPLQVAQAKGEGIRCCQLGGRSIAVTDSTNGIIFPDGTRLWLNKPRSKNEEEQLLNLYGQIVQVPHQFVCATGIATVEDGKPPQYYFAQADLGAISGDMPHDKAEFVTACSYASGGIATKEYLREGLLKLPPHVHFQLSRVDVTKPWAKQDLILGRLLPRETAISQLSATPENYASFVAMSLGIIK